MSYNKSLQVIFQGKLQIYSGYQVSVDWCLYIAFGWKTHLAVTWARDQTLDLLVAKFHFLDCHSLYPP